MHQSPLKCIIIYSLPSSPCLFSDDIGVEHRSVEGVGWILGLGFVIVRRGGGIKESPGKMRMQERESTAPTACGNWYSLT